MIASRRMGVGRPAGRACRAVGGRWPSAGGIAALAAPSLCAHPAATAVAQILLPFVISQAQQDEAPKGSKNKNQLIAVHDTGLRGERARLAAGPACPSEVHVTPASRRRGRRSLPLGAFRDQRFGG